jgi:hypothetical protein
MTGRLSRRSLLGASVGTAGLLALPSFGLQAAAEAATGAPKAIGQIKLKNLGSPPADSVTPISHVMINYTSDAIEVAVTRAPDQWSEALVQKLVAHQLLSVVLQLYQMPLTNTPKVAEQIQSTVALVEQLTRSAGSEVVLFSFALSTRT